MAKNIRKKVINDKDVSYLHRDFESFRNELIRYSKVHYGDQIQDFTEASLSGMFVDMAAYVGDVMSYYLDHQFNELSLETATEDQNVERLIRESGIQISGASPSIVEIELSIVVDGIPDVSNSNKIIPDPDMLCTIQVGTILESTAGIGFELLNNVDFSKKDIDNNLEAIKSIRTTNALGEALTYLITQKALCLSSKTVTEAISIPDTFERFRTITLSESDVGEIISVTDSNHDEYYEVNSLTENTVYTRETNTLTDAITVPERIKIIPAPKRYVKISSRVTGKTSLRFGAGNENIFDEDVIPDPSDHAILLYGDRKTFSNISINPNRFLETNTLGISPRNTTLTIKYRAGGGQSHNVSENTITDIKTLVTKFGSTVSPFKIAKTRASISVINTAAAAGGSDELSLNELRQVAFSAKNLQNRIVTKEDLLARIYSLPNNFGRIFRAGIRDNPFNPFASHLHLLTKNKNGHLITATDTLKENISTYLQKYRLITDAIDIVDGRIINIGCKIIISVSEKYAPENVIADIQSTLKSYFKIENFQIDQPIYDIEIKNLIINTQGVIHLESIDILQSPVGVNNNVYSSVSYDSFRYKNKGIYYPLPGGIFEMKYPDDDIIIEVR
jgi:hypothetical protein